MADATVETAGVPSHHRKVGVLGAAALVAGSMIGSGVYLLPATMGAIGSISILGWLVAALAALSISGVLIWLSSEIEGAEGLAGYVRAGLGSFFGTQMAVMFWVSAWSGAVAVALAAAGAVGFLVPALADPTARLMLTIALIWLAVGLSWIGPRAVARTEGISLGIGLLPVILAATLGWFFFKSDVFVGSWNPKGLSVGQAVSASALNAFWAFLGMECAAAVAGVVQNPTRNVPRATILGVLGAAALYISATSAIMGILPASSLAGSTAPFADAARATLGAATGAAIAICAFLRTGGCLTGWVLVTAETSRGASDQGVFPRVFRTRPGERASPINLLSAGILMTAFVLATATSTLSQQFSTIINAVSLLSLYTYILPALSLARISARFPTARRVGALVTAGVAVAFAAFLISGGKPIELALSLVPIPLATLLHFWLAWGRAHRTRIDRHLASASLAQRRMQVVRDHMALEVTHDWDGVIATFEHPRYEMHGGGAVFDGEAAVRRYFAASRTPFPDQGNEIIAIAHAGNSVLVEFWLTGTHLGPLKLPDRTVAPTGKSFRVRMAATFEFAPSSDKIACERPYFDQGAVARALGLN